MKIDKIYNKPLGKNELNEIKKSFEKLGLKTDSYREYLSKENTIPIGKGKHHIYPVSLFNNDIIYQTTIKWHTRLHLLLVVDNLDRILKNDFDENLLKLTMGACVRYAFGYKKLKNNNTYTYKKSWFFKNDLKFFKKYFNIIDYNIRSLVQKENWKDENYRNKQFLAKQELGSNTEWLNYWSIIDSRFMKELWANNEYREYMLRCREESGAYEKISKSKKKEWKNLSKEEYQERCENISKGTNSVDKSNFGSKTKNLWKNEEYRNHMKLVHTKEYQIEHGTYKEISGETKYKQKLKKFQYSQKKLIERIMKLEDLTYSSLWQNGGYTKLYNHRYLFKLCGVKFKFDKSLIKENFLQDYSDMDTQYLSDDLIPFKQFKKHLIRLINNDN